MTSGGGPRTGVVRACIALLAGLACAPDTPPADLVFVGGAVYTLDDQSPWAEALAVRGRDIVFVGARAHVSGFVGGSTRLVDLDGRLLLPRLGDEGLVAIHEAVTGRDLEGRPHDAARESVEGAIASRVSGRLVAGAPADLTVLQENILKIPPERIGETKVEMTVLEGEIVYVAATFDHHWMTTLE